MGIRSACWFPVGMELPRRTSWTGCESLVDLRPGAVYQHQFDAEAVKQRDVVDDIGEIRVPGNLTAKHQHKDLVAVGINIWRGIPEPAYMLSARCCHFAG